MDISIVGILSTLVVAFGETMNFFNSKQMVSHKMNTLHFAMDTVEPPNRGHFGTAAFVLSSEVVLFSEVV